MAVAPVFGARLDSSGVAENERSPGPAVGKAGAVYVLIAGILGLAASTALTVEKIELLIDPSYVPSCSVNPVISCGSVMVTWQASVLGFANSLIGMVAFTVTLVTGVLTVGGIRLPRWYWAGLAAGTVLGSVFVHWLIFQSLYRIGALCPYCMIVWTVTIPLMVVVSSIALQPLHRNALARAIYQWRWSFVVLWYTSLALLVLVRFWEYWSTLLQFS